MRSRYFRLSALLVASFMVVSLGVTPVLADDDGSKPANIRYQGAKFKHRTSFEISFSGFSRFFRTAYQRIDKVLPFVPPPVFEPDPGDYDQPVFMMGRPGQKDDPNEVPSPSISDGNDPVM